MNVKKKQKNQNGQAIIEFLAFLPFILMMYWLLLSISGAIHGHINQQKQLRGHFYRTLQHDSFAPNNSLHDSYIFSRRGMLVRGWNEYDIARVPVATCFKMYNFGGDLDDRCLDTAYQTSRQTQYIRPKNAYGVCTASFQVINGQATYLMNVSATDTISCRNLN